MHSVLGQNIPGINCPDYAPNPDRGPVNSYQLPTRPKTLGQLVPITVKYCCNNIENLEPVNSSLSKCSKPDKEGFGVFEESWRPVGSLGVFCVSLGSLVFLCVFGRFGIWDTHSMGSTYVVQLAFD